MCRNVLYKTEITISTLWHCNMYIFTCPFLHIHVANWSKEVMFPNSNVMWTNKTIYNTYLLISFHKLPTSV